MVTAAVRQRLVGAILCLGAAVAISVWLFSGEMHVPDAGTVGSYLADGLVILLVAGAVSLTRRARRAARAG
jgi:hypothetical protein